MSLHFRLHFVKKEIALSVLFRICVISLRGSRCSATTGKGRNRLLKGFGSFDTVQ